MSARRETAFNPRVVLGLLAFGALAFIATLYFIGAGETGQRGNDGRAHAAANGLNGYGGLVRLLELDGFETRLSRSPTGLMRPGLVVLTPPLYADANDISEILQDRRYVGPTLLILPKWNAMAISDRERREAKAERGWVQLSGAQVPPWAKELDLPFAINAKVVGKKNVNPRWAGFGEAGSLPDPRHLVAEPHDDQLAQVTDQQGRPVVVQTVEENTQDGGYDSMPHDVTIVIEPDLINNYGLADAKRAALARAIVTSAMYGEMNDVTFDLTLNGFGGSQNLLTLAFRPPFLAATLCLLLAMLIVAWRAFRRFGPTAAEEPALAFGKRRLVANGAGLILRARRFHLLAEPYIALSARRVADLLGLRRPEPALIDDALARRLPDEAPFTTRAAALRGAHGVKNISRAAGALKDLERKLTP